MSYRATGLGAAQPEPWGRWWMESDEVYVLHLNVEGSTLSEKDHFRDFLEAVGRCLVKESGTFVPDAPDVRAAVYRELGSSSFTVSIICTIDTSAPGGDVPSEPDLVECLVTWLQGRGIQVTKIHGEWYHFTDEEAHPSLSYWMAHPVVWDSDLSDEGGPTHAWTDFEGLYVAVDDAGSLGDHRKLKSFPGTPTGGIGPTPVKPGEKRNEKRKMSRPWLWVAGAVALVGVAIVASQERRA